MNRIKSTTFKDVIMKVTKIRGDQLQDDVFFITNGKKSKKRCEDKSYKLLENKYRGYK